MPFDIPEENQDETAVAAGLQKLSYPFAGAGAQPLPYPRLALNRIPPASTTSSAQNLATGNGQLDVTPKLSFAQRIAALGEYPFNGPFSSQNGEGAPKLGIGHRILANASAGTPPAKLSQPLRGTPSVSGFNNGHRYGEFFSNFVPAGLSPENSTLAKSQTRRGYPEDLGRAAGTAIGAGASGPLALAAQKIPPASIRRPPVVDASNLVRARSRIHLPQPVADVKPNLAVTGKNSQKQFKNRLSGLMQGIREAPPPRAVRHLTQDDIERTAHEAYGETARGSVAEHEAIISVILNRLRSGDRQYVDRGQEFTVPNVIAAHTRRGTHQFQALDNDAYAQFDQVNDQGARNARTAAANIAANGPTNRATHFIVTRPRSTGRGQGVEIVQPTPRQVAALGHVRPAGNVGNVYLYEDVPAPRATHRAGGRQHHHGVQQQLRTPNRK